jgi:hypothetical protein
MGNGHSVLSIELSLSAFADTRAGEVRICTSQGPSVLAPYLSRPSFAISMSHRGSSRVPDRARRHGRCDARLTGAARDVGDIADEA